jgi:hypothetical protein
MSAPLDRLRDRMADAPDDIDAAHLPPRFAEARAAIARMLARLERQGMPADTLEAALVAELLPRLVHRNGPALAAIILGKLADSLRAAMRPEGRVQ